MDYTLTKEEKQAVEKYQDNDFKIINSLLRSGIESEIRINSRNGKDYPYMTKEMMEQVLNDIKNLYSAIIKKYLANGSIKPSKPLYRGTKISLAEAMNNHNSSFVSTTTSIVQTMTFSRHFNKGSNVADETERAILLVDGEVPWISIENEFGGGEDEVLFVPAQVQIKEVNLTSNKRYGKEYIMNLSEINIPQKTPEEIKKMKNEILNKTERMSNYLKYIIAVKGNSNFNQNPRTLKVINEYSEWKELVIQYNYQQYRILKNQLMGEKLTNEKEKEINVDSQNILTNKVEREHFMEPKQKKEKLIELRSDLKKTISDMKKRGFEMPDFNDLFQEKNTTEVIETIETIENFGKKIR